MQANRHIWLKAPALRGKNAIFSHDLHEFVIKFYKKTAPRGGGLSSAAAGRSLKKCYGLI